MLRQQPDLQVPAGMVDAAEVLAPQADASEDLAPGAEPQIRASGSTF